MKYKCLPNLPISLGDYSMDGITEENAMLIKQWRNEQMTVLRQDHLLTDEEQIAYYQNVIKLSFEIEQPRLIILSYLLNGDLIGYGGLTNIDWFSQRAEISFLLATNRTLDHETYNNEFTIFLKLIKKIAFNELKFNRLFTETFEIRPWHIAALENNEFIFEGRLKEHVFINGRFVDSLIHGCLKEHKHV